MRKLIQRYPWLQLLIGLILIAVGVGTIAFAASSKINETLYITWAGGLFLVAFAIILIDLTKFTQDTEYVGLIIAGICIGVGVFVWAKYQSVQTMIRLLLPYILISVGGVLLLKTFILALERVPFKGWLGVFIIAVVFLTTGIIFLVAKNKLETIYLVLGVLFIVMGAVEIIGYVTVMSHRHHEKKNAVTVRDERREPRRSSPKREVVEGKNKDDIKLLK